MGGMGGMSGMGAVVVAFEDVAAGATALLIGAEVGRRRDAPDGDACGVTVVAANALAMLFSEAPSRSSRPWRPTITRPTMTSTAPAATAFCHRRVARGTRE